MGNIVMEKGLNFVLPDAVTDKKVSIVEVGPFHEGAQAVELNKFFNTNIKDLTRVDTYILTHKKGLKNLDSVVIGVPITDPITHRATLNKSLIYELGIPFDYVLQSMLNPGTSDAEGDTVLRQVLLKLGQKFTEGDLGLYSKQYFLKGNLTNKQLEAVSAFLANPDLNTRLIIPRDDYQTGRKIIVPIVTLKPEIKVEKFDVANMTLDQLLELNKKRKLAASSEEMLQFAKMYKDEEFIKKRKEAGLDERATDVEIETWFGLRSEHCFHKEMNAHITLEDKVNDAIFEKAFEKGFLTKDKDGNYVIERGIFDTFIKEPAEIIFKKLEKRGKNWIASMFKDNSGVVFYNEDYMFCIKFETHNSPSNKEPIQGAKTGIDGVNRDDMATMLGTFELLANFFLYCTGNPDYKGWLPEGVKHPYVLLKGITQGVREGGNESQIPTLGGGFISDPRFIAKILVYCGTVGWSPVKSPDGKSYLGKHPEVGDLVFVAGQPVGIDGVHGATESSLKASAYISLGHVQADFSYIQAKMKEYLLGCARDELIKSIGDCGAMGISVALELAKDTNGLILDLGKHPKKYAGIQPWQIACSETQDRMVPIVDSKNKDELLRRAKLHDVQVTEIGKLTDSGYAHLKYNGETVGLIDLKKISNKEPRKRMLGTWDVDTENLQKPFEIREDYSIEESLCLVMSHPDIASKEWFFRQKDSSVKGATIQGPLIGLKQEIEADATIQKPLDTEGKDYGAIAYAMGIAPKISDVDAYYSAQKSFLDMVGKIIAVGGALPDMENPKWDAWAVCGNYCQPDSEFRTTLTKENGKHNLASLVREAIGIREVIEKLNIPVISGKDSMKCSCVYNLNLDNFLVNHNSKFAKEFMKLSDKTREDLDKVKEQLGEIYDSKLLESIIFEAIPLDLRKHFTMVERKIEKTDEKGKKYKVKVKSIEIHDPDSYLASAAVKIEDYRKCVDSTFKQEGDLIYVIGTTKNHVGASPYSEAIGYKEDGAPKLGGKIPKADLDEFVTNANAFHDVIDKELVASCSYIHSGLLISLTKSIWAGEKGANIDVNAVATDGSCRNKEDILFDISPGRYVVTIDPKDREEFEKSLGLAKYSLIGTVKDNGLEVKTLKNVTEIVDLNKVKEAYQKTLSYGLQEMKN